MMEVLRIWVRTLAAAALIAGGALALAPNGPAKSAVRLCASLLLLTVLLGPLRQLRLEELAEAVAAQRIRSRELGGAAQADAGSLYQQIIREETEAYILEQAARLGIGSMRVKVTLKEGEACPYPWSAVLEGNASREQREGLADCLEGELGIPKERQQWYGEDEE